MASEFVRCRTGKHYDEHLAELFQAINNDSDLKDFSGDAIRRKREHFKKAYPLLYASLANKALQRKRQRKHTVDKSFHGVPHRPGGWASSSVVLGAGDVTAPFSALTPNAL
jgi:hypothetical protein